MKRALMALIGVTLLTTRHSLCDSPPPGTPVPKVTLAQMVSMSTHIFVGVAQNLVVMDRKGEVKPEPARLENDQYFMLEVRVKEAIKPVLWNPAVILKVRYHGKMFETANTRRHFIGAELIYQTEMNLTGSYGPFFETSDLSFISNDKAEVRALVHPDPSAGLHFLQKEWLSRCFKDAKEIQVGMTRQDIDKTFSELGHGAGFNRINTRYVHPDCPFLSIDVEFAPAPKDEAIALDRISKISKPYLEWLPLHLPRW